MIRIHLKTSFRNLWKNRLLSSLNLLGLCIGIGSVMTLVFSVYKYYTADDAVQDQENIYIIKTILNNGDSYTSTTHPLMDEILKSSPEVIAATHMHQWGNLWLQHNDREIQERTDYVEPEFFEVFSLPLKYGNPETALKEKYSVVLTDKVSQKLFGNQNPMGKTIMANDSLNLTVTGVLEPISPYSFFRIGALYPADLIKDNPSFKSNINWDNAFTPTLMKVLPTADVAQLESRIFDIVKSNYKDPSNIADIQLLPYADARTNAIPIVKTIISGSIGAVIFILLIVIVNLLNLNTSTMSRRTKDIAIRKILGGSKKSALVQFCIENSLLVFAAFMISALLFRLLLLPNLNNTYGADFGKISFELQKDYPIILMGLGIGALVVLMVSVLPSLRFVSIPVSEGIKGKLNTLKGNFFIRNGFMVFQFTIAILFICVAIILNNQISYMKSAPLGFDGKNITVGNINLEYKDSELATSKFNALIDELKANPYVESVATSQGIPSDYNFNYTLLRDVASENKVRLRYSFTDAHYLKTLGIPIAMGRDFDDTIDKTKDIPIIINRAAMKILGWDSIEGKRLKYGESSKSHPVIGIMEDFHYQNLQTGIEPLVHYYGGKTSLGNNRFLVVKTIEGQEAAVQKTIASTIGQMNPRRQYEHAFLNQRVSAQYSLMDGLLKTITIVALQTIFIACLGMFGLMAFMVKRRVKEIGVRKVLGSGVFNVVMLLSKEYLVLTIVAAIIAFPIAQYMMNAWLSSFAFSISIQWWMFALAGLTGLLITACTVGFQAIKAAMVNPVKSLRTE